MDSRRGRLVQHSAIKIPLEVGYCPSPPDNPTPILITFTVLPFEEKRKLFL